MGNFGGSDGVFSVDASKGFVVVWQTFQVVAVLEVDLVFEFFDDIIDCCESLLSNLRFDSS